MPCISVKPSPSPSPMPTPTPTPTPTLTPALLEAAEAVGILASIAVLAIVFHRLTRG